MPRIHLVALAPVLVLFTAGSAAANELAIDRTLLADAAMLLAGEPVAQGGTGTGTKKTTTTSTNNNGGNQPLLQSGSGLGVGLQIGTPTALTLKFPAAGADIVLGVGVGYNGGFRNYGFAGLSVHGDYLLTVAPLVATPDVAVSAYLGPGLWLTLFQGGYGFGYGYYYSRETFLGLGVRFPLGINARFSSAPVEIYLELDPAIFVFPGIDGFIGASLGFRWFF